MPGPFSTPTATHAAGEVQDTPLRAMKLVGEGVTSGSCLDHVIPLHLCTSGRGVPEAPSQKPTARQLDGDGHDTPLSGVSVAKMLSFRVF
jgi:hypothetical protein